LQVIKISVELKLIGACGLNKLHLFSNTCKFLIFFVTVYIINSVVHQVIEMAHEVNIGKLLSRCLYFCYFLDVLKIFQIRAKFTLSGEKC